MEPVPPLSTQRARPCLKSGKVPGVLPLALGPALAPQRRQRSPGGVWVQCVSGLLVAMTAGQAIAAEGAGESAVGKPQTTQQELVVSGVADRTNLRSGARLRLWVAFENRSSSPVHELRFSDEVPAGFKVGSDATCWAADLGCIDGSPVATPLDLLEGEAVAVSFELVPSGESGIFNLTRGFAWSDGDGKQHRGFVEFGAVTVTDRWSLLAGWFKDLALPIVLLLLGSVFGFLEKRRTEVQQTWHQMLPKSHENAELYYMPMSSSILRIREGLQRFDRAQGPSEKKKHRGELYYDLLILLRRNREFVVKIGGWYFKDFEGELLAQTCWNLFRADTEERLGRAALESLLDQIGPQDSIGDVRRRFEAAVDKGPWWVLLLSRLGDGNQGRGQRLASEVKGKFHSWLKEDFRYHVRVLAVLEDILDYEMNRPYDRWYGRKARFPATSLKGKIGGLVEWIEDLREDRCRTKLDSEQLVERLQTLCRDLTAYTKHSDLSRPARIRRRALSYLGFGSQRSTVPYALWRPNPASWRPYR